MKHEHLPPGTIIVGSSYSHCNNCGGDTSWTDPTHHDERIGYNPGPGCGIKFTHITSSYMGAAEQVVKSGRPDLIFIPLTIPTD